VRNSRSSGRSRLWELGSRISNSKTNRKTVEPKTGSEISFHQPTGIKRAGLSILSFWWWVEEIWMTFTFSESRDIQSFIGYPVWVILYYILWYVIIMNLQWLHLFPTAQFRDIHENMWSAWFVCLNIPCQMGVLYMTVQNLRNNDLIVLLDG
jgi:hypothetical protein